MLYLICIIKLKGENMEQVLSNLQIGIFDIFDFNESIKEISKNSVFKKTDVSFLVGDFTKYNEYNLESYKRDIVKYGLRDTWKSLNQYLLNCDNKNVFLSIENLAELYEIGLALQDKQLKKESGQYYTPDDVSLVMAEWFNKSEGINICDVACGTGKLILTYLDLIGKNNAVKLISEERLYLYDIDDVALEICKTILLLKYGKELEPFIHTIHCDFLSKNIHLPENCKVISNPPYAGVNVLSLDWEKTEVSLDTKELYSMFMEKIIKQSKSSVIISPYSFIGGNKFYSLRQIMNNYNGFIVSFDNVPGNIFCGRKHGIFNTNTSNSVRAAITVVENKENYKGFRTTPLIRFKNEERSRLLNTEVLESFIDEEYQLVDRKNQMYHKCAKELKDVWTSWQNVSDKCLGDYISQYGQNIISMPNTCRYFTTASDGLMNRNGQIILNIDDKDVFNYTFCIINSSFTYWYWRLFDGGITYPRGLLLKMPMFYNKLTEKDKQFFREISTEMIENSKKYIITKNNVGIQENIKYPREFRDKINRRLLDIIGLKNMNEKVFDVIHSNMALEINI